MSNKEYEEAKAIYNEQIAPLIEQIDKIAQQHQFSFIVGVQYYSYGVAGSCNLSRKSDPSLHRAWRIIDAAAIWEDEN